jgi:glycosyltransferase involved in cell wall biosynthesis
MKILFLSDSFPPNHLGGAEMVDYNLARAIDKKGHQIFVISSTQQKNREGKINHSGLRIFQIYSNYHERWRAYLSLYNPQTIKKVERIIKRIKPDVVHAHNIHFYLSYHCLKVAKKYSRAVFLTAHDVMLVHYGKWLPKSPKDFEITIFDQIKEAKKRYNPLRNIIIRYYLRYVDKIFTVSNSLKELLEINGLRNISTVYNGIDINDWQKKSKSLEEFKERYKLEDKKVILFGGRVSEAKGGRVILESLIQLVKKIPQVVLLVIGKEDEYAQKMKRSAKKYEIVSNIIFTGWLSGQDLKSAYHSSCLYVFPSLCFEGFGLPCLEAMATKKPVVASYFGGPSEIVKDNQTGYLVNPYQVDQLTNKILDLLIDSEKSNEFGKKGYLELKERFLLERQVSETLNWYKKYV